MRKLKGITIDGVWLGDNVRINGLFRAICSLAPFVMPEFIRTINSIDKLDEAISINKFSFPDNNTIEIEFSNSSISGLADLYFRLENGAPKFANSRLVLNNTGVNGVNEDNVSLNETEIIDAEQKNNIISDTKQVEEDSSEALQEELETTVNLPEESCGNQDFEGNAIIEEAETIEKAEDTAVENIDNDIKLQDDIVPAETNNDAGITRDMISGMVDEIIAKAPNFTPAPIQIQLSQPESANIQQPIVIQNTVEKESQPEITSSIPEKQPKNQEESTEETKLADENTDVYEIIESPVEISDEPVEDAEEDIQAPKDEVSYDSSEEELDNELIEDIQENIQEESEETVSEEMDADDTEEISDEIEEDFDEPIDIEDEAVDTDMDADNGIECGNIENDLEEDNDILDSANEEEIGEYLADFYKSEDDSEQEYSILDEKAKDNIAMQAMLTEMMMLKEELNKLKSEAEEAAENKESVKPTLSEFFGDNEPLYNDIEDEDADFKIMAGGTRINASILDEDMFIAGNKLYRWGDTLYLDE